MRLWSQNSGLDSIKHLYRSRSGVAAHSRVRVQASSGSSSIEDSESIRLLVELVCALSMEIALSQPQSNAGSIDIAHLAPHTLLNFKGGPDKRD